MRSDSLGSIPVLLALTISLPASAATEPSPPPEPNAAPVTVTELAPEAGPAVGSDAVAPAPASDAADEAVEVPEAAAEPVGGAPESDAADEAVEAPETTTAPVGDAAESEPAGMNGPNAATVSAPRLAAPILSPPAPTWGPVRPTPPPPPDPERTQRTMKKFRRGGAGMLAVGATGLAVTIGLQAGRGVAMTRCASNGDPASDPCVTSDTLERELSTYGALGLAALVTGSAGAGVMFGNAAATRDVELRGKLRKRSAAKMAGIVAVAVASSVMLGANIHLTRAEARCDGDPNCIARHRPTRWAANNGASLGLAAGAGLLGYAIAYDKQGKALMKLRAAPTISARQAGLSLTMAF